MHQASSPRPHSPLGWAQAVPAEMMWGREYKQKKVTRAEQGSARVTFF